MRLTTDKRRHAAPWRSAAREVGVWLRAAPRAALLELVSRAGFLARGVVYVSTGALALLAALDLAPHASGVVAAMAVWSRWPAGLILIWLTAIGLLGFAVWRGLQGLFDADDHGRSPRGMVVRIGQGVSGLAHALLAWSLFSLLEGLDDLSEVGEGDAAQAAAATALSFSHGDLLLVGAGGVVLASGFGSIGQGLFQNFAKRLGCSEAAGRWAVALARLGYVGRGMALAPMGFFLVEAGLQARASRARDFAAALQALEDQPFGSLVLGLAAACLMAFGLFAFFESGFRRIDLPSLQTGAVDGTVRSLRR